MRVISSRARCRTELAQTGPTSLRRNIFRPVFFTDMNQVIGNGLVILQVQRRLALAVNGINRFDAHSAFANRVQNAFPRTAFGVVKSENYQSFLAYAIRRRLQHFTQAIFEICHAQPTRAVLDNLGGLRAIFRSELWILCFQRQSKPDVEKISKLGIINVIRVWRIRDDDVWDDFRRNIRARIAAD